MEGTEEKLNRGERKVEMMPIQWTPEGNSQKILQIRGPLKFYPVATDSYFSWGPDQNSQPLEYLLTRLIVNLDSASSSLHLLFALVILCFENILFYLSHD